MREGNYEKKEMIVRKDKAMAIFPKQELWKWCALKSLCEDIRGKMKKERKHEY